jgi:ferredoxin-NADP reductase
LAQAKRYQFIAGGIGITPIMAMIASADKLGIDWHLLYGGRSRGSMAFLKELEQYGDRVTVCPQDTSGLLDLTYLDVPVEGSKVYCCGPEPLLAAVKSATAAWQPGFVRFERFVAAAQPVPVRSEPFIVELARSQMSMTVNPDESVLDVLNRLDKPVLSSCREGVCGTCEVPVLCGVPDHRDSMLTDDERAKNDRMFVCVSRSISDRLVLDL